MKRYKFIATIEMPEGMDEVDLDMYVYKQMKHSPYIVDVEEILEVGDVD